MIPRKGDTRTSLLSLPNQERKADNHFYLLEAIWIDLNLNKDAIVKFDRMSVSGYRLMRSLREDNVDLPYVRMKIVEHKMLGPAVVQRTKDIIDLIRGQLVVARDGHKKYVDSTKNRKYGT
ncbi:hypothetical protein AgCh_005228 [Apium graveolens]